MQRDLLESNIDADVRVYAVWFAMLAGDARDEWDQALLPDARVRHFWDEERLVGRWFARKVEGWDGIVWDAYYLYDAEARWEGTLPVAVSSGATVIDRRETLLAGVQALMALPEPAP
ncbi:MAG: hypothetical protein IT318_26270 [Anaerolineales bacterium]|nr:hypothetical protein [Anaerolineales bacterium]